MRAEERIAATNNECASIAAGAEVMKRWPGGFLGPRQGTEISRRLFFNVE